MAVLFFIFYDVVIISAGFFNKKKPVSGESGVPAMATAAAGSGKAPSAGLSHVGEGDYVGVPTDRR
jgi:hypothetical protein